jgi:hypothetical protein
VTAAPASTGDADQAFFVLDSEALVPDADRACGPWADDQLHGRLVVGLFARAIEREAELHGFRCVRLTVDLFRVIPLRAMSVTLKPIRCGRRLRLVDLTLSIDGAVLARGSAAMQQATSAPPGEIWRPAGWSVPTPGELTAAKARSKTAQTYELRQITAIPAPGEGIKVWTREAYHLVAGERLTPLVRLALAADLASPLSAWSDSGLHYINSDVTVHLQRMPAGQWVGLEVTDHLSSSGLAIGQCRMHDEAGALGWASMCALAVADGGLRMAGASG